MISGCYYPIDITEHRADIYEETGGEDGFETNIEDSVFDEGYNEGCRALEYQCRCSG